MYDCGFSVGGRGLLGEPLESGEAVAQENGVGEVVLEPLEVDEVVVLVLEVFLQLEVWRAVAEVLEHEVAQDGEQEVCVVERHSRREYVDRLGGKGQPELLAHGRVEGAAVHALLEGHEQRLEMAELHLAGDGGRAELLPGSGVYEECVAGVVGEEEGGVHAACAGGVAGHDEEVDAHLDHAHDLQQVVLRVHLSPERIEGVRRQGTLLQDLAQARQPARLLHVAAELEVAHMGRQRLHAGQQAVLEGRLEGRHVVGLAAARHPGRLEGVRAHEGEEVPGALVDNELLAHGGRWREIAHRRQGLLLGGRGSAAALECLEDRVVRLLEQLHHAEGAEAWRVDDALQRGGQREGHRRVGVHAAALAHSREVDLSVDGAERVGLALEDELHLRQREVEAPAVFLQHRLCRCPAVRRQAGDCHGVGDAHRLLSGDGLWRECLEEHCVPGEDAGEVLDQRQPALHLEEGGQQRVPDGVLLVCGKGLAEAGEGSLLAEPPLQLIQRRLPVALLLWRRQLAEACPDRGPDGGLDGRGHAA
mmetsp:Transcript_13822/g.54633  ORF Transcript_13822/g.54633 Transcript_13822/m.54633 type:complete len:533 (-) Transcript_13822:1190-2788(-)